jgi:hypothetical protein
MLLCLSALGRLARRGHRLAVIAFCLGCCGAAAPVSAAEAQASPAPSATPNPNAPQPVGPQNAPPRAELPAPARFGHLPIIDIIPIYTQPEFYDARVQTKTNPKVTDQLKNAGVGYDPADVGGTIRIPITPIISASFDRLVEGTLDVPNARVSPAKPTKAIPYTYPTFSRDVALVYRLDEQVRRFTVEEGLYFRHRIVGGANTSNNPYPPTTSSQEAHFGYVGVTYATPGVAALLHSFVSLNINADTQTIDHHVGCAKLKVFTSGSFSAPCVDGVFDPNPSQNRVWETDQYVQLTVPIDRDRVHGLTAVAQDRWGALNFYENAAFPYRWTTSQTYLLTKRFDRVFALSLRLRDQWAVPQGAPYVKPNTQHNGTVDVLADFRVDTNHLH